MTILKRKKMTINIDEDVVTGILVHCFWEHKILITMDTSMEVPQEKKKKLKIELPYDPTTQLLGIYLVKTLI